MDVNRIEFALYGFESSSGHLSRLFYHLSEPIPKVFEGSKTSTVELLS